MKNKIKIFSAFIAVIILIGTFAVVYVSADDTTSTCEHPSSSTTYFIIDSEYHERVVYCPECGYIKVSQVQEHTYYGAMGAAGSTNICDGCGYDSSASTDTECEHFFVNSVCSSCGIHISKYSWDYVNAINSVTGSSKVTFSTIMKNSSITKSANISTSADGKVNIGGWAYYAYGVDHYVVHVYIDGVDTYTFNTSTTQYCFSYDLSNLRSDHTAYLTNTSGISPLGAYTQNGIYDFYVDLSAHGGKDAKLVIFAVPEAGGTQICVTSVSNITVDVSYWDINSDGVLNKYDYKSLSGMIYASEYSDVADLNADSAVDLLDLGVLSQHLDGLKIDYSDLTDSTETEPGTEGTVTEPDGSEDVTEPNGSEDVTEPEEIEKVPNYDVNEDGVISTADAELISQLIYLSEYDEGADLNFDGVVDLLDYGIMLQYLEDNDLSGSEEAPTEANYDLNADGVIDEADANVVRELIYGGEYYEAADYNGDGVVDLLDYGIILQYLEENGTPCSEEAHTWQDGKCSVCLAQCGHISVDGTTLICDECGMYNPLNIKQPDQDDSGSGSPNIDLSISDLDFNFVSLLLPLALIVGVVILADSGKKSKKKRRK